MTRNTTGKGVSLKDELFNKEKVEYLATLFSQAASFFNQEQFIDDVMKDMLTLELKQRIVCIAKILESQLPRDFETAAKVILAVLPEPLDPNKTDNDFGDFIYAPLGEYVVRNGLSAKYLQISLNTLREITMRFSMEDAIRYFLNEFPEETMQELALWMNDRHYHVRRLVSEGTRPLLPWSGRIGISVTEPLPFLDSLHADHTRYVTRSVANHLNDISKSDPDIVIQTLQHWKKAGRQDEAELDWMVRHALRTLLKQGYAGALNLLGYNTKPHIYVSNTTVNRSTLKVGENLEFSFSVSAQRNEKLMIDYVIDFVKANGMTNPKVFKLKKLELKKGESVTLQKKHLFRKDATTFKLYPGAHTVRLQINGKQYTPGTFTLV